MLPIGMLILALATPALHAAKPKTAAKTAPRREAQVRTQPLDTTAIRALYVDGEFEQGVEMLETARREGRLKTHGDSVFAFKHLGVMHAAKYETQEIGKRYMYQLLSIEPSVRILDMYASDMIYMIFKNVQAEYEMRNARPGKVDSVAMVSRTPFPGTASIVDSPKASRRRTWPFWTAGAAILAAGAGVTAYLLLEGTPPEPTRFKGGL